LGVVAQNGTDPLLFVVSRDQQQDAGLWFGHYCGNLVSRGFYAKVALVARNFNSA
jgi:hypothetical protein